MEKTLKISTKKQLEKLTQLMEDNPALGRGKGQFGSSRQNTSATWAKIADVLNGYGPPTRTGPEWQRVWVHYKANLKRKLAKNKENPLATGVGTYPEVSLNPNEERVYQLINFNVSADPLGDVFGLKKDEDAVNKLLYTSSPAVTSASPAASTSAAAEISLPDPERRKRKSEENLDETRIKILKVQAEVQQEKLRTLKRIEKTINNAYELIKKQTNLMEQEYHDKKELRAVKMELAKAKLQRLQEEYLDI